MSKRKRVPIEHPANGHWSKGTDSGAGIGLRLTMFLCRHISMRSVYALAKPVSFFYWLFDRKARRYSRRFLDRMSEFGGHPYLSSRKHFYSFALSLLDKVYGWSGTYNVSKMKLDKSFDKSFFDRINAGKGCILICSHLGNSELLRALAQLGTTHAKRAFDVISLVDFSVSKKFNTMLKKMNPDSMTRLIPASEIGLGTIGELQECLDGGGVVVIAGDRTSSATGHGDSSRELYCKFLGKPAPFPKGPFYIAAMLKYPVYFVCGIRDKVFRPDTGHLFYVNAAKTSLDCPRSEREERINEIVVEYSNWLERKAFDDPYQWYNFYDFWEEDKHA